MKKIFILILSLLIEACATQGRILDLPKSKLDYELCKPDLLKKYPDIEEYEKMFRWELMVPYQQQAYLQKSLGQPEKTNYSWIHIYPFIMGGAFGAQAGLKWALAYSAGFGGLALLLNPVKVETWKKGNYEIEAKVQYSLLNWDGSLIYFNWNEIKKRDCKT